MSGTAWYHKHSERIKAERRAAYALNPELYRKRAREFRALHLEQCLKAKAEYRKLHHGELAELQKARYHREHEKHLAKNAIQRAKNREKNRAHSRYRSREVTDSYVREQLAKHSRISAKYFPASLVEAKRLQIITKRLVKKKLRK